MDHLWPQDGCYSSSTSAAGRPPVTLDAYARPHAHKSQGLEAQHGKQTSARHIYREPASYLKLLYQQPLAMDILQIHHHCAGWHYADDRERIAARSKLAGAPASGGQARVPRALSSAARTAATV
jgi:hypothetical protein